MLPPHACHLHHCKQLSQNLAKRSQTTTTATTLSPRRVGWGWGDVLDTADLHAGTGEGTEGGLGTWAWGLGTVACDIDQSVFHRTKHSRSRLTTSSPNLDVEGSDAQLLAAGSDVLSSQHGSVWGGLVTVGLDLHSTGDTGDGFAATGITQVSLCTISSINVYLPLVQLQRRPKYFYRWVVSLRWRRGFSGSDVREIGDVDEGVVERGEDTGNAKDELACSIRSSQLFALRLIVCAARCVCTDLRGPEDRGRCSPAHRAQPSSLGPLLLRVRSWSCRKACPGAVQRK